MNTSQLNNEKREQSGKMLFDTMVEYGIFRASDLNHSSFREALYKTAESFTQSLKQSEGKCVWKRESVLGLYETACGSIEHFSKPLVKSFKFCPFCGKEIQSL